MVQILRCFESQHGRPGKSGLTPTWGEQLQPEGGQFGGEFNATGIQLSGAQHSDRRPDRHRRAPIRPYPTTEAAAIKTHPIQGRRGAANQDFAYREFLPETVRNLNEARTITGRTQPCGLPEAAAACRPCGTLARRITFRSCVARDCGLDCVPSVGWICVRPHDGG